MEIRLLTRAVLRIASTHSRPIPMIEAMKRSSARWRQRFCEYSQRYVLARTRLGQCVAVLERTSAHKWCIREAKADRSSDEMAREYSHVLPCEASARLQVHWEARHRRIGLQRAAIFGRGDGAELHAASEFCASCHCVQACSTMSLASRMWRRTAFSAASASPDAIAFTSVR